MVPIPRNTYLGRILERLGMELDPKVFEDCVWNLLLRIYPGIVPVRGGSDHGFDGAVADGEGEPYSLIVTTAEKTLENLRTNLTSLLRGGSPRRKAILATSRELTGLQRQSLYDEARRQGFTLVQVYDRHAIAELLHARPDWTKRLLHLDGAPCALSRVPATLRPFHDLPPIGREADLEWLRGTRGDRILCGQPGSGKTFLLRQLAREGEAHFLAERDPGRIADAVRELQPREILVDDAHESIDRLRDLVRLRTEIGADFAIIASTWGFDLPAVADALGHVPESRTRWLELLTRKQILEVYELCGVRADSEALRQLVTLAANKPGLAALLAQSFFEDPIGVLRGDRLTNLLLHTIRRLIGHPTELVVACYALGGDEGVRIAAVADFLGRDVATVRADTIQLGAGGIISEGASGAISVWPRVLRCGILRSVLFPESAPHFAQAELERLLAAVENRASAVEALVQARRYGAGIESLWLRTLVRATETELHGIRWRSRTAWNGLAAVDPQEARWVIENYPGPLVEIAESVLASDPRSAIPRILELATARVEPPEGSNRLLQILTSWSEESSVSIEGIAQRRELLARSARSLLAEGKEPAGFHAIALACSPTLHSSSLDPGEERTLTIHLSTAPIPMVHALERLWEESTHELDRLRTSNCGPILDLLQTLLHPRQATPLDPPHAARLRSFARRIASDLVGRCGGCLGLLTALQRLFVREGIDLPVPVDAIFERLYPSADERGMPPENSLEDLAESWARRQADRVAEELAGYEEEARGAQLSWPRRTPELAGLLARRVDDPDAWLRALAGTALPPELMGPFVERVIAEGVLRTPGRIRELIDDDRTGSLAAIAVIRLEEPPRDLLRAAIARAGRFPMLIEYHALRGEIPEAPLRALLSSMDWIVALAAAVGMWVARPREDVNPTLEAEWHNAILRSRSEEQFTTIPADLAYWRDEILGRNGDLAFEWLRRRLEEEDPPPYVLRDRCLWKVLAGLTPLQRAELIGLPSLPDPLIHHIVGGDPVAYEAFVQRPDAKGRELLPLRFFPNDRWAALARRALDLGFDPAEIADRGVWADAPVHDGSAKPYWHGMDEYFSRLESDRALQEVARAARRLISRHLARESGLERSDELGSFR